MVAKRKVQRPMKVFHPVDFQYHIALAALQRAEELDSRDKKNPREWGNKQEFEMKSARVTAVTFSALCLEAVIHHVLASHNMRIPKSDKTRKQKGRTYLELAWLKLPSLFGASDGFNEDIALISPSAAAAIWDHPKRVPVPRHI